LRLFDLSPSIGKQAVLFLERTTIMNIFPMGRVVATPAALEEIEQAGQNPMTFLKRHGRGDWGDLCDEDKRANDQALLDGERLLSAYKTLLGVTIWILTEATNDEGERESTSIILPSEY
jgi:hypothetical protein